MKDWNRGNMRRVHAIFPSLTTKGYSHSLEPGGCHAWSGRLNQGTPPTFKRIAFGRTAAVYGENCRRQRWHNGEASINQSTWQRWPGSPGDMDCSLHEQLELIGLRHLTGYTRVFLTKIRRWRQTRYATNVWHLHLYLPSKLPNVEGFYEFYGMIIWKNWYFFLGFVDPEKDPFAGLLCTFSITGNVKLFL